MSRPSLRIQNIFTQVPERRSTPHRCCDRREDTQPHGPTAPSNREVAVDVRNSPGVSTDYFGVGLDRTRSCNGGVLEERGGERYPAGSREG